MPKKHPVGMDSSAPRTVRASATAAADAPLDTGTPHFAEPMTSSPDPTKFTVKHGSDTTAYTILDQMRGKLRPRPFPVVAGVDEPILKLAGAYGTQGDHS